MHHLTLNVLLYILHAHGLENLALHKPTWEQYPWPDERVDCGSENAVDGLYDDRGTGGQCTISDDGKYNATWRVDLGGVVSINKIDIYYRTDNQRRYVIYYNERRPDAEYPSFYSKYAYNELCEVKVYGCKGIYGDDCIHPCPAHCKDRSCDTNTGHCLSCSSGYKGLECHIVCNKKTYGPACALKCGNCSNGETCHHINGSCLHGCAEGALGDTCQEGCQSGYYGRNCSHRCSENCIVTSQCDRFTGRCDGGCKPGWTGNTCNQVRATDTQPSSCTEIYNIVIVVVSILTVVTGSLINFVIWKRNVAKLSRMSRENMPQPTYKTEDKNHQYTELEEVDKSKTYEEIHRYSN